MVVVFDLDGTLIDSMHIWRNAAVNYIRSRGIEPSADLAERIYGTTVKQAVHIIRDMHFPNDDEAEMYNEVLNQIISGYKPVAAKSGALRFVKKLKQMGIKTAIASASNDAIVLPVVDRLGFKPYFDRIYSGIRKNTPDIFYKIADDFKVAPSECWMVEDALYSIRSAKEAGYKTLAVYDYFAQNDANEIKKISDLYYTALDNTECIIKSMGV